MSLPWTIEQEGDDYTVRNGYGEVVILNTAYYPVAPEIDDAEFILKAVNLHQKMVDMLRDLRIDLEMYEQEATGEGYNHPDLNELINQAEM